MRGRLSGRIAATDHGHVQTGHRGGLSCGGPVEHAATDQGVDRFDTAHPIANAAGQDDTPGTNDVAVGERQHTLPPVGGQHDCCSGHDDLRSQLFRLPTRGVGEIGAPDSPGKPEIVTDVGACTRLTANGARLHGRRTESLG